MDQHLVEAFDLDTFHVRKKLKAVIVKYCEALFTHTSKRGAEIIVQGMYISAK